MYESRFLPQAITVFTTNERVQLFQAALGLEPDFRCDYEKCPVLFDELFNLGAAGGQLAILDEDFWLFGGFCGRDSGIGPAQRAKTTIWN